VSVLGRGTGRFQRGEGPPSPRAERANGLPAWLCALLVVRLLAPTLAGAVWAAPVTVSGAGEDASSPQVAVDADGDAIATWMRSDGTNTRIQASGGP
jgi:hypothetical protein